jgi:hypothetical protein
VSFFLLTSPSNAGAAVGLTISEVLQGMLSPGIGAYAGTQTSPLELTDLVYENSLSIRLMLDMIYGVRIDVPALETLPFLVPAVLIMKKYECDVPLEALRLNLRIWAADIKIISKIDIFAAAAHLNDIDTCCLAIHRGGNLSYASSGKVVLNASNMDVDQVTSGVNQFDPAGWTRAQAERVPMKYMLAWIRVIKGWELATLTTQPQWFELAQSLRGVIAGRE